MSDDARKQPKYSWDYEVPNNPFWNSMHYTIGRNFLECFNKSEISKMTFDETLPFDDKLKYLLSMLDKTFANREKEAAPTPLYDADYKTWRNFKLGMSTLEHFAGNFDKEEAIARERYENGPNGVKDISALHELCGIMEATGRYEEGESMAKDVLPWMESHQLLGKESPQAISCMRLLAACIWKQKKYKEGGEWVERCKSTIENMDKGKFAKYQGAERRQVDELVAGLKKWKKEHGGT